jgi:hypothetical protein
VRGSGRFCTERELKKEGQKLVHRMTKNKIKLAIIQSIGLNSDKNIWKRRVVIRKMQQAIIVGKRQVR